MSVPTSQQAVVIEPGHYYISNEPAYNLKAVRVASSVAVIVYDPSHRIGGIAHMALPDSKAAMAGFQNSPLQFVDIALPRFVHELIDKGLSRTEAVVKIVGGAQLFNFGGGTGNILNIGTRNAITARTILTREGLTVEKTETGGNKPRTILFEIGNGQVTVSYPGETPRVI